MMSITGIILSGGKSSRMGQDKGLLQLNGRSMMEIAIERLSIHCDRIIISANSEVYDHLGLEVVHDIFPDIGPMGGLYSALTKSTTEYNIVLSVDLPFVNEGLINYLIASSNGFQLAVPWSGNEYYEPLCACYHISVLTLLEGAISSGNFKLPSLFQQMTVNKLIINSDLPFYNDNLFFNINNASDFISAEKLSKSIDVPGFRRE
ncbi:MAG: molybdenum cofactor guanylyltransferase [Bacteroidales bacterium]|nr:molybdenum cofactor guanylyltransferase [Bacteroidales bacterium]